MAVTSISNRPVYINKYLCYYYAAYINHILCTYFARFEDDAVRVKTNAAAFHNII